MYQEIVDECTKAIEVHNKKLEELNDQGKEIFESFVRKLFELNPKFKSFSWTQYTPSWNDGDTCYFSVNCDLGQLKINGISFDEVDNDSDGNVLTETVKEWKGIDEPWKLGETICELLESVGDDILEVYGEGEITLKRSGKVYRDSSVGDY